MNKIVWTITMLLMASLFACSNGGESSSAGESVESQPSGADEGVFDPMVETIDRAKAVEDIGLERKAEMDERMKELE